MNDTITVRGIVATEPRHLVTETGLSITSLRLASPSRRWDRQASSWANGPTNWFTVTAFRSLATNAAKSLNKGDRVIVTGRLRVRPWERAERSGTSIEIDAEGIGQDLAWGVATWVRVPRHVVDAHAGPGEGHRVDQRTGEVRGLGGLDTDGGVPGPELPAPAGTGPDGPGPDERRPGIDELDDGPDDRPSDDASVLDTSSDPDAPGAPVRSTSDGDVPVDVDGLQPPEPLVA